LLMISAIRRRPFRLCSSLCSSSPKFRLPNRRLDGGFADHRRVNDSIAAGSLRTDQGFIGYRHVAQDESCALQLCKGLLHLLYSKVLPGSRISEGCGCSTRCHFPSPRPGRPSIACVFSTRA